MIAACPKCQTRYRLKPEQISEGGIRLRCRQCEALFRVLPPPTESEAQTTAPRAASAPPQPSQTSPPENAAADPGSGARDAAPGAGAGSQDAAVTGASPLLLVGFSRPETGKRLVDALGIGAERVLAVGTGEEALLAMHRNVPRVAILDASLPGLGGHAVCEVVKRSPLLREVRVLLLQGSDAPTRDAAAEGFSADLYLDPSRGDEECRSALVRALREWGVPVSIPSPPREAAGDPAPATPPTREPAPPAPDSESMAASGAVSPSAPEPAASASVDGEEIQRAERLARIAVSDIVLYNEEKFAAAVRSEDPLQAMRDEVEEGRALLRGRIDEKVFATRDFVSDELLRQVRERA